MPDVSTGSRAVALAAVVCVAAPIVAGCGALKQIGAASHTAPARNFTITGKVTTVVIDGGASSITVTGSGRTAIGVTQQASYSKTPPTALRSITGTTLTLSYECTAQPICGVAYDVRVPRGVAVRASTRAGTITLSSLAGALRAQTGAGLITADNLSCATATLKSSAGGIVVAFSSVPGSVNVSTKLGPIGITVPGAASYQIHTHTYVGSSTITVHKNPASPHVITASSDVGSITIGPS